MRFMGKKQRDMNNNMIKSKRLIQGVTIIDTVVYCIGAFIMVLGALAIFVFKWQISGAFLLT